jgi:hypothetical protein
VEENTQWYPILKKHPTVLLVEENTLELYLLWKKTPNCSPSGISFYMGCDVNCFSKVKYEQIDKLQALSI